MIIEEVRNSIWTEPYRFLWDNPQLGTTNICLLGLGGSYAYGTNVEGSDVDIRGVATRSARDIMTGKNFEQVVNEATDTTVYSLEKIVNLLSNCNPNTIELLGLEPWQYLYLNDIGKELVQNADMFLSKKAAYSFGGYANAQLRRLENAVIKDMDQAKREEHILGTISHMKETFSEKYAPYPCNSLDLYIDESDKEEYDTEIFMDITLHHYPLRDYTNMWSDMKNVIKDYSKIGKRNDHAMAHNKLGKHMMHLVRLYLMAFDILEDGKIVTLRTKDHDLLMDIRNGKYLDENDVPTKEFFEIVDELESRLKVIVEKSPLPKNPDYNRIEQFLYDVNRSVVLQTF